MPSLHLVDAFADRPFTGNPAAIVLTDSADAEWMQAVAMEMNQAETAFVGSERDGVRPLRWFTPTAEVELCGHATLAAAHALDVDRVVFSTLSGLLAVERDGAEWAMDFPAEPPIRQSVELGAFPTVWTGRNRMDWFLRVEDPAFVREYAPDFAAIAALGGRGVILTALEGDGYVCRCFFPNVGIDEDPVTGSAHCGLAPYWAAELGRTSLRGYQASRRGGWVATELRGERVVLRGAAITTVVGELRA